MREFIISITNKITFKFYWLRKSHGYLLHATIQLISQQCAAAISFTTISDLIFSSRPIEGISIGRPKVELPEWTIQGT